jgi:CRP-like cAMP-binding protein
MPLLRRSEPIVITDSPLFAGCSGREQRTIGRLGTGIRVEIGATVIPEGEAGHEFFVIERGHAYCSIRGTRKATFEPGGFFGEMALLDGGPRTATVTAQSPMDLVVFGEAEFTALLDASGTVRHRLLVAMAQRLRTANAA